MKRHRNPEAAILLGFSRIGFCGGVADIECWIGAQKGFQLQKIVTIRTSGPKMADWLQDGLSWKDR